MSSPSAMPMRPPLHESTTVSTRNWMTICRRRAPMARRMPISRVRSVTEASMMFMIPMPPTSRLMPAIDPSTMLNVRFVDLGLAQQGQRHADAVVLLLVKPFQHRPDRRRRRFHPVEPFDLHEHLVQFHELHLARSRRAAHVHLAEPVDSSTLIGM